jgi:hypothetical protein
MFGNIQEAKEIISLFKNLYRREPTYAEVQEIYRIRQKVKADQELKPNSTASLL